MLQENFSFQHKGETYWYSRSMTTVVYVFAYCHSNDPKKHGWYILANKRGPGCPSNIGKFNVPCGYLDHNEKLTDAAIRECFEETGVKLDSSDLQFAFINSTPDKGKQNVDISFYVILKDDIENIKTTYENSEPDEVEEIKWINIRDIESYDFAFNQKPRILQLYKKYVDITVFKSMMLSLTRFLMKKFIFNPML